MPTVYVIGGANGAGKTTTSLILLPTSLNIIEFVNADAIAAGISPLNPESMAIQAGRIMLERLDLLSSSGADFAFETTLASRTFAPFLRKCKDRGYAIALIYFWLRSPELAIERVLRRVAAGGHSIPEDVVRRRYERGRTNLTSLYFPLVDEWIIFDNSESESTLVAEQELGQNKVIYNNDIWSQIIR
jgi:predicted ABC-type ATPase